MVNLTIEQNEVVNGIMAWVNDDRKPIAILIGSAGTGKTTLLRTVVEKLSEAKKTYSLLAPTGRAARILGKKTGKPSKTIHSEIYELGDIKADEDSGAIQSQFDSPGFVIPFKLKDTTDSKATIYIVDESSMVSDQTTENEILSFGSGRLLHDLLYYARIITAKKVKSKILFVGDDAQLPPVKCPDSPALTKRYFLSEFKLDSELFQLDKVLRQTEGSLILENAENIRNSIFAKDVTSFNISEDGASVRKVNAIQAVKDTPEARDAGNSVIITVSNRDALLYNMAIRKERFGTAQVPIQKGDILLVCRNSAKNKYFNGDLLTSLEVDPNPECRSITIRGGTSAVDIIYRNVLVRSVDDEGNEFNQVCKVIENLLFIPSPTLSLLENRAMMADFRKRHPSVDISSDEFRIKLLEDEYFNALLVKFGYAITCHKAQGGEWDNVYVKLSGFPNRDSGFYRWAYTAITRGRKTVGVIEAPSFGESILQIPNCDLHPEDEQQAGNRIDPIDNESERHLQSVTLADDLSGGTVKKNNRGEKWSSGEDDQLRSEFGDKKSITEMSVSHGRTKGAITSRLNRLGLYENTQPANVVSEAPQMQVDLVDDTTLPIGDEVIKPRSGTWKKSELEKVLTIWKLSNRNSTSIKLISSETGRSHLAIIIQLYKAKQITLEGGDFLCKKCECVSILSNAVLSFPPGHGCPTDPE